MVLNASGYETSATYEAIKSGKDIALANKETLVTGGKLIIDETKKNVSIIPVDANTVL